MKINTFNFDLKVEWTDLERVHRRLFTRENLPGALAAKGECRRILKDSMSFEEAKMFSDIPEVSMNQLWT